MRKVKRKVKKKPRKKTKAISGKSMSICKECSKEYSGGEWFSHLHGKNHPMYGQTHSIETKRSISKSLTGKKHSQKTRRLMSIARTGKKHSKETGKKLSKSNIRKWKRGVYDGNSKAMKKAWKNGVFDGIFDNVQNIGSKGKRWKVSKKRLKQIGLASKRMWRDGVFDNAPIGRGKSGFRKDIGHFVRSRWEANFARILKYLGIDYQYEKHRFNTPDGSYTPDFYILSRDLYYEIKGYDTDIAKRKRIYCRKKYGVRIIVVGHIRYKRLIDKYENINLYPMKKLEIV